MSKRVYLPILLIIACVGAIGIVTQRRQLTALQQEKSRIDTHNSSPAAQSSPPSSSETVPSAAPAPELLALRSKITQLTQRKNELAGVRAENENLHTQVVARGTNNSVALPPGYIRRTQAQWVGMSTPENTIQSFLWALQNRDLTNLLQVLTPESAEGLIRNFNQPFEQFFNNAQIPGMRIVSQRKLPDGSILAEVEIVPGNDIAGHESFTFKEVAGQWKLNIR